GEMLDRIETNIEDAVDYAEKARQNVKDARELLKKARKRKILICILVAILVLILIIFIQSMICHFTPIC
ncbi:hypothetical protein ANCDUO_17973, partial [Ancylostoma duodenale]